MIVHPGSFPSLCNIPRFSIDSTCYNISKHTTSLRPESVEGPLWSLGVLSLSTESFFTSSMGGLSVFVSRIFVALITSGCHFLDYQSSLPPCHGEQFHFVSTVCQWLSIHLHMLHDQVLSSCWISHVCLKSCTNETHTLINIGAAFRVVAPLFNRLSPFWRLLVCAFETLQHLSWSNCLFWNLLSLLHFMTFKVMPSNLFAVVTHDMRIWNYVFVGYNASNNLLSSWTWRFSGCKTFIASISCSSDLNIISNVNGNDLTLLMSVASHCCTIRSTNLFTKMILPSNFA